MRKPEKIRQDMASFTFTCAQCGACCREEGLVFFSREEIRRASEYLNIPERDFIERYFVYTSGGYTHRVEENGACAFLNKNKCIINEVKPEQCGSFPFWREYIADDGSLRNFDRACRGKFRNKS